jgi:hypothetical protein
MLQCTVFEGGRWACQIRRNTISNLWFEPLPAVHGRQLRHGVD